MTWKIEETRWLRKGSCRSCSVQNWWGKEGSHGPSNVPDRLLGNLKMCCVVLGQDPSHFWSCKCRYYACSRRENVRLATQWKDSTWWWCKAKKPLMVRPICMAVKSPKWETMVCYWWNVVRASRWHHWWVVVIREIRQVHELHWLRTPSLKYVVAQIIVTEADMPINSSILPFLMYRLTSVTT